MYVYIYIHTHICQCIHTHVCMHVCNIFIPNFSEFQIHISNCLSIISTWMYPTHRKRSMPLTKAWLLTFRPVPQSSQSSKLQLITTPTLQTKNLKALLAILFLYHQISKSCSLSLQHLSRIQLLLTISPTIGPSHDHLSSGLLQQSPDPFFYFFLLPFSLLNSQHNASVNLSPGQICIFFCSHPPMAFKALHIMTHLILVWSHLPPSPGLILLFFVQKKTATVSGAWQLMIPLSRPLFPQMSTQFPLSFPASLWSHVTILEKVFHDNHVKDAPFQASRHFLSLLYLIFLHNTHIYGDTHTRTCAPPPHATLLLLFIFVSSPTSTYTQNSVGCTYTGTWIRWVYCCILKG